MKTKVLIQHSQPYDASVLGYCVSEIGSVDERTFRALSWGQRMELDLDENHEIVIRVAESNDSTFAKNK